MLSEKIGIECANKIVEITKANNKILSFDVNYRDDIYESSEQAVNISMKYIKEANILKFSEDEIALLSKEERRNKSKDRSRMDRAKKRAV